MRFTDSYDWGLSGELNEAETIFKALCEENCALHPDRPHEVGADSALTALFDRAFSMSSESFPLPLLQKRLEEKSFFAPDNDIEIYRHMRYLPCGLHTHDFLEIICVIQGGCANYIGEQWY